MIPIAQMSQWQDLALDEELYTNGSHWLNEIAKRSIAKDKKTNETMVNISVVNQIRQIFQAMLVAMMNDAFEKKVDPANKLLCFLQAKFPLKSDNLAIDIVQLCNSSGSERKWLDKLLTQGSLHGASLLIEQGVRTLSVGSFSNFLTRKYSKEVNVREQFEFITSKLKWGMLFDQHIGFLAMEVLACIAVAIPMYKFLGLKITLVGIGVVQAGVAYSLYKDSFTQSVLYSKPIFNRDYKSANELVSNAQERTASASPQGQGPNQVLPSEKAGTSITAG